MKIEYYTSLFLAILISFPDKIPSIGILGWIGILMGVDFMSAFIKATIINENKTSTKLKGTVVKFCQYGFAIAISSVLKNLVPNDKYQQYSFVYDLIQNGLLLIIVYTEIVSILENITAMDPNSKFVKYFISPIHKIILIQVDIISKLLVRKEPGSDENKTQDEKSS